MPLLLCTLLLFAPFDDPVVDEPTPEEESAAQLAKVRRIYIDILTGGDEALKIRDLLMTSLQSSKQFIITEDEEKADATLEGFGRRSGLHRYVSIFRRHQCALPDRRGQQPRHTELRQQ